MKMFALKIFIIAFMLSHAYPLMAHVALDYPQGGENFIVGESIIIQWHIVAPHETLNWDLFFSPDGGVTWDTLQLNIPTGVLSYEWEIPYNITSQARVRVIQDNVGQNYLDNSMDFSIAPNTDPPLLDEPANDIIIECNPADQEAAIQAWLNNHGGASATNYCGDLVWTHDYAGYSNDCGATGSTLVIFTAEDECGMLMTNALLTIADTNPPDINLPAADIVVESNGQGNEAQLNAWLNIQGGAQASDECGNVAWSHTYSTLDEGCGSTGQITAIFTATDECGNSASTVATFTIEDQLGPNIIVAAQDTTFTCGASTQQNQIQQWLDQHGGAEVFDTGGDVTWTHNYAGLSDGCGLTGGVTVIFTATDECGNSTTITATLTVEDITAPAITTPAANATLECAIADQEMGIQQWLANHGGAQATDGCSEVTWEHNYSSLSNGCGGSGMANVIFTATDGCGNRSTSSAFIWTVDHVAPVIDNEAQDTTIICGINDQPMAIQSWLNRQGGASANDHCGNVTWTNDFPFLPDTCGPTGSHIITFTAIDECGNSSAIQATLTIMDSVMTSTSIVTDFDFILYPNPVSDFIHIEGTGNEYIIVNLFNAVGSQVYQGREKRIDLKDEAPGYYYAVLLFKDSQYRIKGFVKL